MIDYKAIGRRISIYRKKSGMTHKELSQKLNISDAYISSVENGKSRPSLSRLQEIADCLGVEISYIICDNIPYNGTIVNTTLMAIIQNWNSDQIKSLNEMVLRLDKIVEKKK